MSEDPHSPTSAGPEPVVPAPDPMTEPPPAIDAGAASVRQPAGSAVLGGVQAVDPHPEKRVGAAFAGGLVAALVLKGLARRRHA